jgi:thiamine-monophosphate kinase
MSEADPDPEGVDEFDLIARLLRPLTDGAPEALGLLDDAAILPPLAGQDLVISADMIVEGVHFLPSDPLDQVAQKLLRVNLSDLAAKGAEPYAYFLTIAWPARCGWLERQVFAAGLRRDQDAFGLKLLGGDTTATPGPLTASATILGRVGQGQAVLRSGARPGDLVLVSGCIGDGWLGLQAALGRADPALLSHYRTPEPRTPLAGLVRAHAHAAADVSDGLAADAGHIAKASGVALELELERIPLSPAGRAAVDLSPNPAQTLLTLATAGDDYEIVLTAPPDQARRMMDEAPGLGAPLTVVGRVVEGQGVRVLWGGDEIRVPHAGYRHR